MKIAVLSQTSPEAIAYARALLARCESGETVEVTALEVYKGGRYEVLGPCTRNRHETAGRLLEAAVTRLGVA